MGHRLSGQLRVSGVITRVNTWLGREGRESLNKRQDYLGGPPPLPFLCHTIKCAITQTTKIVGEEGQSNSRLDLSTEPQKVFVRDLVNFVPAVAYLFCLNLPAAFSRPRTKTFFGLCIPPFSAPFRYSCIPHNWMKLICCAAKRDAKRISPYHEYFKQQGPGRGGGLSISGKNWITWSAPLRTQPRFGTDCSR